VHARTDQGALVWPDVPAEFSDRLGAGRVPHAPAAYSLEARGSWRLPVLRRARCGHRRTRRLHAVLPAGRAVFAAVAAVLRLAGWHVVPWRSDRRGAGHTVVCAPYQAPFLRHR